MTEFSVENETKILEIENFLTNNSYLCGGSLPGREDALILEKVNLLNMKFDIEKTPQFYGWWWTLCSFQAPAMELWKADNNKKVNLKHQPKNSSSKKKKSFENQDDQILDLDEEIDNQLLNDLQDQPNNKNTSGQNPKQNKTKVVFDIKGFGAEYDFEAIDNKIKNSVIMDGLTWLDAYTIQSAPFGLKNLQQSIIIDEDLIHIENVLHKVKELGEEVQLIEVVEKNKL